MSNRRWLKEEIPRWVDDGVISEETGKKIISRYKGVNIAAYKEAFFILAIVCIIGGIFFLCASLWAGLTQDERFLLGAIPMLISFLIMLAVVLTDEKIPDPIPQEEESEPEGDELLSDSETPKLPKKKKITYHHKIPVFIREAAAIFHGICMLGGFWVVSDSFKLTTDAYSGLALTGLLLFLLTLVTRSAGMGILYMLVSVGLFYADPLRSWPSLLAWLYMFLALGFLGFMLREHRDRAVVCYSWVWAVGILLLIFWSAGNMLWQTIFFSLAASLTWMAGTLFRSYGLGADALRFFGGIAVFAVLLEGSYGTVWAGITGSYALWFLFLLFLAADGVLLIRIAKTKEWLSALAGLTPFIMGLSALISILDVSGALPAMIVSIYTAILGVGVIGRGFQMDRPVQSWCGVFLLVGDGAIRVLDSALSFAQRGLFFLAIGVAAAFISWIFYITTRHRKKPARPQKVETEEEGDK